MDELKHRKLSGSPSTDELSPREFPEETATENVTGWFDVLVMVSTKSTPAPMYPQPVVKEMVDME